MHNTTADITTANDEQVSVPDPCCSRRTLLKRGTGLGVGLGASAVLAGCSDAGGPAATPTPGSVPVGRVPVGGGVVLDALETVVTQPSAGEFHAFSALCTHKGCPVNRVDEEGIHCPCHSSVFDSATGAPVAGPATRPLPARSVSVEANTVHFS